MSLKLPPNKKRSLKIPVPVSPDEKAYVEKLAAERGVSASQIVREGALAPKGSQFVKGAKKTKAA